MKIIRKGEAKGKKGVRNEKEQNYKGRKRKVGNEGRIEGENK